MSENKDFIKFEKWICHLTLGYYGNKRLAIKLVSAINDLDDEVFIGSPIATATINIPEIPITSEQTIIKNYSENNGILQTLIESGYISNPKEVQDDIYIVDKTEKLIELEKLSLGSVKNKIKP